MSFLPDINYIEDIENSSADIGNDTFRLMLDDDRLGELITDSEAVLQTAYVMLSTERYKYNIFDRDFGIEFSDMIGADIIYIKAVLPQRIKECLLIDDRIIEVNDISITEGDKEVYVDVTFTDIYYRSTSISQIYDFS